MKMEKAAATVLIKMVVVVVVVVVFMTEGRLHNYVFISNFVVRCAPLSVGS
jgi:hypothetical protein